MHHRLTFRAYYLSLRGANNPIANPQAIIQNGKVARTTP